MICADPEGSASGDGGPDNVLLLFINISVVPITQYTHVRNINNGNTQGSFPNVVKVIFNTFKVRIRSLWGQFKRSSDFENGRICREALLDTVVSLRRAQFFQRSGYDIN